MSLELGILHIDLGALRTLEAGPALTLVMDLDQVVLHVLQNSALPFSVADPDPDPPDPHVFGPLGSGSTSQRYGSGSGSILSIIMQK